MNIHPVSSSYSMFLHKPVAFFLLFILYKPEVQFVMCANSCLRQACEQSGKVTCIFKDKMCLSAVLDWDLVYVLTFLSPQFVYTHCVVRLNDHRNQGKYCHFLNLPFQRCLND